MYKSKLASGIKTPAVTWLTTMGGLALLGASALLAGAAAKAQDAVKIDAKHYKVEFENDPVRVLRIFTMPDGRRPSPRRQSELTKVPS